jgi:hypothetical protein
VLQHDASIAMMHTSTSSSTDDSFTTKETRGKSRTRCKTYPLFCLGAFFLTSTQTYRALQARYTSAQDPLFPPPAALVVLTMQGMLRQTMKARGNRVPSAIPKQLGKQKYSSIHLAICFLSSSSGQWTASENRDRIAFAAQRL